MYDERLSPDVIIEGLPTLFVGQNILYYPSLESTNDVARKQASAKAAEGTVVIAGQQTTGRGRLKRAWVSPQGNIAASIILYPTRQELPYLIMLIALAVFHSIGKTTGLECRLKWPNDVLIDNKKVCGILVETKAGIDTVDYAVIGIGMNVNIKLADYPEIASYATSLSDEAGRDISLVKLLQNLFAEVERLYLELKDGKSPLAEWKSRLITLGKEISVISGGDVYEGIAESVADDGSLLLRCPDGVLMKFMAGDVTLKKKQESV